VQQRQQPSKQRACLAVSRAHDGQSP
jgi:hypothetical protein